VLANDANPRKEGKVLLDEKLEEFFIESIMVGRPSLV